MMCSVSAQKLEERLAAAHAQLDSNHFFKAHDILREASRKFKENGRIYAAFAKLVARGKAYGWYLSMGTYNLAPGIDTAKKLIELDKDWEPDLERYSRWAIEEDKKYALGYEMRAVLEIARKEFDKAAADIAKAMELDPNSCYTFLTRGNLYLNTSKWDSSLADLSHYLQCEKGNYVAYNKRAFVYANLKQFDLAMADVKEAERLYPRSKDVSSVKIMIAHSKAVANPNYNIAEFDEALEMAKQAILTFPRDETLKTQRDEIYLNRTRVRSAAAKALITAIYNKDNKAMLAAVAAVKDKTDLDVDFPNTALFRKEDHPLTYAVATKNFELAEALLKAGANPDVMSDRRETSLRKLAWMHEWSDLDIALMARLLFRYGANPNIADEQGETPLYGAILYDRVAFISELVKNKIDINRKNNQGLSAFSYINGESTQGFVMMKMLIDGGANLDIAIAKQGPFINAVMNAPYSLQGIYLMVKAGVTENYPEGNFTDVKNYIKLLKNEVIGKPAAELFDAMLVQDVVKFKAALKKAAPGDTLVNYLYLANIGGPYSDKIDDELRHEGASDEFRMYDARVGYYQSVASMKATRFSKPKGDGFNAFYYMQIQEISELLHQSDAYFKSIKQDLAKGEYACTSVKENYNTCIKVIRIYNQFIQNDKDGSYKITDKRKAEVNKHIATMRNSADNLKQSLDNLGCGKSGLLVE